VQSGVQGRDELEVRRQRGSRGRGREGKGVGMWRQVMSGEAGNLLRRQVRSLRLGSPLQSKFGVLSSLRFPGGLDSVSGCQSKVGYSSSSKEAVEEGLLIDTLEVMRGFERSGMKRAEADELTRHITKLILQTSNQFSAKFASQVSCYPQSLSLCCCVPPLLLRAGVPDSRAISRLRRRTWRSSADSWGTR